jgi:hypothetical protein
MRRISHLASGPSLRQEAIQASADQVRRLPSHKNENGRKMIGGNPAGEVFAKLLCSSILYLFSRYPGRHSFNFSGTSCLRRTSNVDSGVSMTSRQCKNRFREQFPRNWLVRFCPETRPALRRLCEAALRRPRSLLRRWLAKEFDVAPGDTFFLARERCIRIVHSFLTRLRAGAALTRK